MLHHRAAGPNNNNAIHDSCPPTKRPYLLESPCEYQQRPGILETPTLKIPPQCPGVTMPRTGAVLNNNNPLIWQKTPGFEQSAIRTMQMRINQLTTNFCLEDQVILNPGNNNSGGNQSCPPQSYLQHPQQPQFPPQYPTQCPPPHSTQHLQCPPQHLQCLPQQLPQFPPQHPQCPPQHPPKCLPQNPTQFPPQYALPHNIDTPNNFHMPNSFNNNGHPPMGYSGQVMGPHCVPPSNNHTANFENHDNLLEVYNSGQFMGTMPNNPYLPNLNIDSSSCPYPQMNGLQNNLEDKENLPNFEAGDNNNTQNHMSSENPGKRHTEHAEINNKIPKLMDLRFSSCGNVVDSGSKFSNNSKENTDENNNTLNYASASGDANQQQNEIENNFTEKENESKQLPPINMLGQKESTENSGGRRRIDLKDPFQNFSTDVKYIAAVTKLLIRKLPKLEERLVTACKEVIFDQTQLLCADPKVQQTAGQLS